MKRLIGCLLVLAALWLLYAVVTASFASITFGLFDSFPTSFPANMVAGFLALLWVVALEVVFVTGIILIFGLTPRKPKA